MRLILPLLLLVACDDASERQRARPFGVRPAGCVQPLILYPRHRIVSPVPVIQLAVPWDPGPVGLELVTSGGLRRKMRTRRRSIEWPPGMRMLRAGEQGSLRLRCAAGVACAGFEYHPAPAGVPALRSGRPSARDYLDRGFPMEALRLLAVTEGRLPAGLEAVMLRSGFPRALLW